MNDEKVILLAEAEMIAEFRETVLAAAKANLPLTLAEPGCEAFFQTVKIDEPNKIVFFEVFASEEAHASHLAQEYTKKFFASIEGCFTAPPSFTRLKQA
jgi:quinol monooxygenase YgiN